MQTDFVHAGQVRLQIFCQGSGPNLIVLVHGYRASGRVWRLVQESLDERRFRTIAINNVGAGDSDRPNTEAAYTFEAFSANLWDAVTTLGLDDFTPTSTATHPSALPRARSLWPLPVYGMSSAR